jgi:5,10-methylenetetrahydromethanopterin reductase
MTARPEWWMLTFPMPGGQAGIAQFAESVGWDGMVFADTQNLAADVYGSLCLAAAATERLQLGTGVTNPVTRHPAVTAAAIATVQVASGGRAVLGIGRGDSSLAHLGRAPETPAAFERYVRSVQQYLRDEPVDLGDGVTSRNEWIGATGLPKVPVDVAATGPKVIGIGARLADRVTFAVGADPERVGHAIATARRARVESRLDPMGVSLGVYVNVVAHPDVAQARALVRGGLGSFAHFSGMKGAPSSDLADAATYAALGSSYDLEGHGKAEAGHQSVMSDEFVDRFGVVGPPDECVVRLQALVDLGIDRIVVIGGSRDADPSELIAANRRLMDEVAPNVHLPRT